MSGKKNEKQARRGAPRQRDTAPLPQEGFAREPAVLGHVPFGRSTLWNRVRAGTFPAPVKLSPRITAWRVSDIRRFIAEQGKAA